MPRRTTSRITTKKDFIKPMLYELSVIYRCPRSLKVVEIRLPMGKEDKMGDIGELVHKCSVCGFVHVLTFDVEEGSKFNLFPKPE
ncbi:MAG TPA: hypothetical protein VK172_10395 [Lentimicrobium sp.]|nr:hypothetical protein [Lentimicrobium sp.]